MATSKVSKDMEITGSVKFAGELHFEGRFHGDLIQGDTLVVAQDAEVKSKIVVENLTASGSVDGEVSVANRCHLKPTAHLKGNLKAGRLVMEDGAQFEGGLEMSKPTGDDSNAK